MRRMVRTASEMRGSRATGSPIRKGGNVTKRVWVVTSERFDRSGEVAHQVDGVYGSERSALSAKRRMQDMLGRDKRLSKAYVYVSEAEVRP